MNRRSFFSKLRNAAVIVALAPQLAFKIEPKPIFVGVRQQLCSLTRATIEPLTPLDLQELFNQCYEMKRRREEQSKGSMEIYTTEDALQEAGLIQAIRDLPRRP